ncbi:hypothetical protein ACFUN7_27660 [Streptomyces sp. NPDC057236]|uniref:hypothetical protein n=1 Tax=Streptomyces sp. NPDC057236 TaxID=3346059 RepID=UPI00363C0678
MAADPRKGGPFTPHSSPWDTIPVEHLGVDVRESLPLIHKGVVGVNFDVDPAALAGGFFPGVPDGRGEVRTSSLRDLDRTSSTARNPITT